MNQTGNWHDTAAFLNALWPVDFVSREALFWEMRCIRPAGGAPRQGFPRLPLAAQSFARAMSAGLRMNRSGHGIYVGVQPRFQQRGRAVDIPFYVALPLDYDSDEDACAAYQVLTAARLLPNIVSETGRGAHFYFLLDRPYSVQDGRRVGKRLCAWTGSDSVFDPARVMRLPGFVNTKPAANGFVCRVLKLDASRRYSLADIVAAMDASNAPLVLDAPPRQRRKAAALPAVSTSGAAPDTTGVVQLAVSPGATPIDITSLSPERRETLEVLQGRLSPRMRRLLHEGMVAGDPWRSRSEAEFGLVRALARLGAEDDDIIELFRGHPCGIAARTFERGVDALLWTIERVRTTPAPSGATCAAVVLAVHELEKDRWRALLNLRVLDGPWAGASIAQGLSLKQQLWPHVFRSAGLEVPLVMHVDALQSLRGMRVHVELRERCDGLEVAYWRVVAPARR